MFTDIHSHILPKEYKEYKTLKISL